MKQLELFDELPRTRKKYEHLFSGLRRPLWTENKAKMIALYLRLFVFITKHGAYIDGFAGHQEAALPESWTAKLVLESEPKRLNKIFLCEINKEKLKSLRSLVKRNIKKEDKRLVRLFEGDFNSKVNEILSCGQITEKTATFALLDQHTFECSWKTVRAISAAKKEMKIEIFYFVPTGWLKRALSATKKVDVIRNWWGRDDWADLKNMSSLACVNCLCERFRDELGYEYAYAWPIYERKAGKKVMYYMIHATDHYEAPKLMHRAYKGATGQMKEHQLFLNLVTST
jgi:three-Cys-motif partner protein